MINKANQERYNNAIVIYAKHYDDLRLAANAVPNRLYVSAKTANCSSSTLSGISKDQSGNDKEVEEIFKTELPASNLRQLNEVIGQIEQMQLKCERLLNTVSE